MKAILIIVLLVLLLTCSAFARGKKELGKISGDACACKANLKPVCDSLYHVTYPSACIAKCMGVTSFKKGKCKANTVVRSICKKEEKEAKETKVLLKQLLERTKLLESRIESLQQRIGKQKVLKNVKKEISNIVSAIPSKLSTTGKTQ